MLEYPPVAVWVWFKCPDGGVNGAADTKLSWSDIQPDSCRRASCSCSWVRCSWMSRAFSWAASAIERSASSRACFSRDHRSRSRSELCLALLTSVSRIRCSKLRMKFLSSCSLSWSDAHSCFTWDSRSDLSERSFLRSSLRPVICTFCRFPDHAQYSKLCSLKQFCLI